MLEGLKTQQVNWLNDLNISEEEIYSTPVRIIQMEFLIGKKTFSPNVIENKQNLDGIQQLPTKVIGTYILWFIFKIKD